MINYKQVNKKHNSSKHLTICPSYGITTLSLKILHYFVCKNTEQLQKQPDDYSTVKMPERHYGIEYCVKSIQLSSQSLQRFHNCDQIETSMRQYNPKV